MGDTDKPGAATSPLKPAATGTDPAAAPDATPFMLDGPTIPLPWGHGVKIAPVVSAAQTNVSADDLVKAFGKQDVQIELDTLTNFANKVDALLQAMEGSAAAPYKLQEQKVSQGSFINASDAGKFPEAVALHTAYDKVHDQLVKLHKDFAAQIEAMKAAVTDTHSKYTSNEDHTTAAQKAVAAGASGTASTSNVTA
ncbi:hypothetical protein ABZW30_07265 [Kitasatospora sp. NPDC004669]|uniref:hypothetical protein n=1 Tax=Kitasatospora sp. NPDC004669 TaxID=3154555 RepID=UPI0033B0257A